MSRYYIEAMVFESEQYGGEWPPENALEFLAWFQSKLTEIPDEYKAEAKVVIDSDSYYDSTYARIRISYSRPETDAECEARLAKERENEDARRRMELAQLAALKAKYGEG